MKDDIREAIKFITSLRVIDNYILLSQKEVVARNTKLNDLTFMIDKLGKFEEMWRDFKSTHGYRTTYNSSGDQQLCRLEDIMDKAEVAFLGSRPKTKREKINAIIDMVDKARSGGRTSATDILHALIELRDEEENV